MQQLRRQLLQRLLKAKGKSAALSHLFFQATNSTALLRRSDAAREKLADLIEDVRSSEAGPTPHKKTVDRAKKAVASIEARPEEVEVVFAFLGKWGPKGLLELPLFSRVAMAQAVRQVQRERCR